ncbi:MAG: cell division protein SepF [Oscillospiraceae bacterium]|jgi:cell division inhibitor SepF|nr:cell division protein SepF [Oscillospiraceae bacterium]
MGLLDELKKLTRPYSGNEYDDFGDEYPETPAETRPFASEPQKKYAAAPERRNPFSEYESHPAQAARRDKVVNIGGSPAQAQVVLVKPERFETAAEIADHLRERRSVLMNLEQTGKDTARRLIDFLSGVAYALDGKIKRVSANTYIITPYNVDVLGDLIDEIENSSLYM